MDAEESAEDGPQGSATARPESGFVRDHRKMGAKRGTVKVSAKCAPKRRRTIPRPPFWGEAQFSSRLRSIASWSKDQGEVEREPNARLESSARMKRARKHRGELSMHRKMHAPRHSSSKRSSQDDVEEHRDSKPSFTSVKKELHEGRLYCLPGRT